MPVNIYISAQSFNGQLLFIAMAILAIASRHNRNSVGIIKIYNKMREIFGLVVGNNDASAFSTASCLNRGPLVLIPSALIDTDESPPHLGL